MRTLSSEARTNGPEGLATGVLGHPITPHSALLKSEKPPTRALGQVQTSRGEGQEGNTAERTGPAGRQEKVDGMGGMMMR